MVSSPELARRCRPPTGRSSRARRRFEPRASTCSCVSGHSPPTKTRYGGLAKNRNLLRVAIAPVNLLMTARATVIQTRLTAAVIIG